MGPQGVRTFRALFAGTVSAVLIGLLAASAGTVVALVVAPASPGWIAFSSALMAIMLFTPTVTARLMGVRNHHLMTGYAFGLVCGSMLLLLGILYVPLIPLTPAVVAGASVAGIRYAEYNDED